MPQFKTLNLQLLYLFNKLTHLCFNQTSGKLIIILICNLQRVWPKNNSLNLGGAAGRPRLTDSSQASQCSEDIVLISVEMCEPILTYTSTHKYTQLHTLVHTHTHTGLRGLALKLCIMWSEDYTQRHTHTHTQINTNVVQIHNCVLCCLFIWLNQCCKVEEAAFISIRHTDGLKAHGSTHTHTHTHIHTHTHTHTHTLVMEFARGSEVSSREIYKCEYIQMPKY